MPTRPVQEDRVCRLRRTWRRVVMLAIVLLMGMSGAAASDPEEESGAMTWTSMTAHWNNGTLPPPHRRSGTVVVRADGTWTRTDRQGYGNEANDATVTHGRMTATSLAALKHRFDSEGFATVRWQEADRHPVGGPMRWLSVQTPGGTITTPAFPVASQEAKARALFDAVMDAVRESATEAPADD